MKSNKQFPTRGNHVEQWHRENDGRLHSVLMIIARPETPTSATIEDRAHVQQLIDEFLEASPPLDGRDVMGLVVLRLISEFWPPGRATDLDAELASLEAMALATTVVPLRMRDAGFAAPIILHPLATPRLLETHAQQVRRRWLAWYREAMDPYVPPAGERQSVIRDLARLHCMRQAVGEQAAARKAKQQLDAHFRRRGQGKANLDSEDILQELYALDRGQLGKSGILWLREDGLLAFDHRRMRDTLRTTRLASLRAGSLDAHDVADREGSDPAQLVEHADGIAALLDRCDDIDRVIVENWATPDVALAKKVDLSPQAVGKRRRSIQGRAQRLDGKTPE